MVKACVFKFTLSICVAALVSCRTSNSSTFKTEQTHTSPAEVVSGKISRIDCAAFDAPNLNPSCVLELVLDEGASLRLVSDDVFGLTKEQREGMVETELAVHNNLIKPMTDESVLKVLVQSFGAGTFSRFTGDLPWLCFRKLAPGDKCGLSFPSDYKASPDSLNGALVEAKKYIYETSPSAWMLEDFYFEKKRKEYPTIEKGEVVSITAYTDMLYSMINRSLRSKDPAAMQPFTNIIASATSGLRKLKKHQGTVYRGALLGEENADLYVDAFNLEDPILELAFVSTSYDESSAFKKENEGDRFGIRFEITSYTGVEVENLSIHPDEKEVLFAPGTWFQVTGISTEEGADGDRVVIQMAELVILH
ncbi:MAG: ADP-ribosyltransferase domain-containing protein [Oligoflexales bacterium]